MTPDQASNAVVSWIGIVLQLAGSLLCLGLGLILRQKSRSRRWLTCWVASYAAISVAVAALLARYYLLPLLPIGSLQQYETRLVALLYAVYLSGKLAFLFCLLTGTWLFVTRKPLPKTAMAIGLATIAAAGVGVLLVPTDLDPLMGVQAAIAIPVFLACAWLLFRKPPARRTRGSRLLAVVCVMLAGLWLLYIPGFLMVGSTPGPVADALRALTFHNSYVDVLFEFLLGFGMIIAVLDDAFLEAEQARAALNHDSQMASLRMLQRVGQRFGDHEVAGRLHGWAQPRHVRLGQLDVLRRPLRERPERGHQSGVGEDRRVNAPGEFAQLAGRCGQIRGAVRQQGAGFGIGCAAQALLGQPQRQRRDHQPLLHAVVQVALQPAAFGVGGGHDPAAGGPYLGQLRSYLGGQALVLQRQPGRRGHGVQHVCVFPQRLVVHQGGDPPTVALHQPDVTP